MADRCGMQGNFMWAKLQVDLVFGYTEGNNGNFYTA